MSAKLSTEHLPTSSGLRELMQCVSLMLTKVERIERRLDTDGRAVDLTAPLSAEELCVRWNVRAETKELKLLALRRKCERWGLRAMSGARGWDAMYRREDVVHAEGVGAGDIKRRKRA